MILLARGTKIEFPRRPLIMGIVNITADSFVGDGSLDIERALTLARRHVAAGADIIDVGGESARTNRDEISEEAELARLTPFTERFDEVRSGAAPVDAAQLFPPLLSINTWRPRVSARVLDIGGHFLNDISALPTDENARIAAKRGTALLIMHSIGRPKQRHTHIVYDDVLGALEAFFKEKIDLAIAAGVTRDAIVLDPGIDFAKQKPDSLRIYRHLGRLKPFERPILLPVSRKTVIGETLDIPDPAERDPGTIACLVAGTMRGASLFRVHNVHAASQALRVIYPILSGASLAENRLEGGPSQPQ
jgi:dihydropteroate synthase